MGSLKLTWGKLLPICLVALAVIVIAVTVFKVSVSNILFFGIFLACPLMHVFMMKGHGGHDHKETDDAEQTGKPCH